MRQMPLDIGTLHFVGIGGIGMSGIAEVLHALGYGVQGSDIAESANVKRMQDKGIRVAIGHDAANLKDGRGQPVTAVVVSSAIKGDNPELAAARAQRLPVVRRAEMLAELMRLKWSIAIGGTHGKTTTTSLVGAMLEEGGYDPTVINGGIVNKYGTNTRLGQSDWMVVEADESDGTFTKLPATVAVVTNIDPEHMEHYGSFEALRRAFHSFIDNLPFYGFAALCSDHGEVQALIPDLPDKRVITYGLNPQADVQISNIRPHKGGQLFDVRFAGWLGEGADEYLKDTYLPMPGQHNVTNAGAALVIAHEMGIAPALMQSALESFAGVKRRFTTTGVVEGITIIDDYGHHPVEIEAVLKAGRQAVSTTGGRLIAVMQPHRYSRLHDLFEEFCTCFNEADSVIIADVYTAGEDPVPGADRAALARGIRQHGHRNVAELEEPERLAQMIADTARNGDYVICLGAGDITKWANALPGELEDLITGSSGLERANQ